MLSKPKKKLMFMICDDPYIKSLNANVNAGFVINNPTVKLSFPTDNSKASQSARLNAAAVTLQNLHGPGKGCPIAGTTFAAQQKAIDALPNTPAPASTTANVAPVSTVVAAPVASPSPTAAGNTANGNVPSAAQIAALAPPLGFTSGKNPTGTGDCDGAVNGEITSEFNERCGNEKEKEEKRALTDFFHFTF